jgi:hypothetical protein
VARRVLALIFVGLALIVCVALAASESLTNRTGRTATAVTVTFSGQVRITSYDQSIFPTKEPSSRSESFRFRGGELENGARFSVSWTPSTAEITSTEWETTGASAATSSSSAGAPLTFDQIMAQIAQYPGPDEPLYVPAEGEQIWLTDLEGHADIYDNDSIKINYAPGFDKSQITRIDVCRNGVKMRFLPALFDVVTNDQMKTFDGSPEEHSPKSSHTDHAIMGYSYRIQFAMAAGAAAQQALLAAIKAPFAYVGATRLAFIGHDFVYRLGVSDAELRSAVSSLLQAGYTGIQLGANHFMATSSSNDVFAQFVPDRSVCEDWMLTPSDDELRRVFRAAREAGADVELRIEIWLAADYERHHQTWRGAIAPSSVRTWFANYETLCLRYAAMAQEEHVDSLCIGVELASMGQYADSWTALATAVRKVYTGRITVNELTHVYLSGSNAYNDETRFEQNVGKFWAAMDSISMSCYPDAWQMSPTGDARFSDLVSGFVRYWTRAFDYYRQAYPGKPVRFGEMGAQDRDGMVLGYSADSARWVLDNQEFADIWAAYLIGAAWLQADGISVWVREINRWTGSPFPGTYTVNDTPARLVIEALLPR